MSGNIVVVTMTPESYGPLIQRLGAQGHCVHPIKTVPDAFAYLQSSQCTASLAMFDVSLRRQQDFDTLAELTTRKPLLHILLLSEKLNGREELNGSKNDRIHWIYSPISHPGTIDQVEEVLAEVSRTAELAASAPALVAEDIKGDDLLYYSDSFLRRVGEANVPVLLHGETGVGKEVMARRLWACSPRSNKPFLKLNCAALPSELIESELFGYEKGAFTGATADKQGRFETAQNGTILLDEIGDMDVRLQAKLLHVLQDGEIQPLGSSRTIKIDVRIIAATHRDLRRAIDDGTFREDLFYRLNVVNITIPPLRERKVEIIPLAKVLLRRNMPPGAELPEISPQLQQALLDYRWPGNVRELENVMRRLLVYQDAATIMQELQAVETPRLRPVTTGPIDSHQNGKAEPASTIDRLAAVSREAESRLLLDTLELTRWNRRQAAARLNIEYKAFLYKLQKHGLVEAKSKRDASV
jgi:DNA-binding NtrC family response regulator